MTNVENLSLKHVRDNCLDCCGGSRPAVIWCTCHGQDGTKCPLWPFRFGMQPATFRARYGDRLLTPELMPDSSIELETLPGTLEQAATAEIEISGYHQPAVVIDQKPKQALTPGQKKGLQIARSERRA